MIDHEHGAFDLETIANLAGWFQATNLSAIVRIHKSFMYLIPAILDQGIMGIQVSEVDNANETRAIAREAKYPPIGDRGISGQGMRDALCGSWAEAKMVLVSSIKSWYIGGCNDTLIPRPSTSPGKRMREAGGTRLATGRSSRAILRKHQ